MAVVCVYCDFILDYVAEVFNFCFDQCFCFNEWEKMFHPIMREWTTDRNQATPFGVPDKT